MENSPAFQNHCCIKSVGTIDSRSLEESDGIVKNGKLNFDHILTSDELNEQIKRSRKLSKSPPENDDESSTSDSDSDEESKVAESIPNNNNAASDQNGNFHVQEKLSSRSNSSSSSSESEQDMKVEKEKEVKIQTLETRPVANVDRQVEV